MTKKNRKKESNSTVRVQKHRTAKKIEEDRKNNKMWKRKRRATVMKEKEESEGKYSTTPSRKTLSRKTLEDNDSGKERPSRWTVFRKQQKIRSELLSDINSPEERAKAAFGTLTPRSKSSLKSLLSTNRKGCGGRPRKLTFDELLNTEDKEQEDEWTANIGLLQKISISQFVAVEWKEKWYPGQVIEWQDDKQYTVKCMEAAGAGYAGAFRWPDRDDVISIKAESIIDLLPDPVPVSSHHIGWNAEIITNIEEKVYPLY